MTTIVVILASTLFQGFFAAPLFLIFARKARHLFWAIPAVNLSLYLIMVLVRPYPGGIQAMLRMPGLLNTILELTVLVVFSFGMAALLAVVYWLIRLAKLIGSAKDKQVNNEQADTIACKVVAQENVTPNSNGFER